MKKNIFVLFVIFSFTSAHATSKGLDVIYGDDDRLDVYASSNSVMVELSRSTAAMISALDMKSSSLTEIQIFGKTLQERGICAEERFSQQMTAASCSGFLVSPTILVTAGHCIKTIKDCRDNMWVFDYKVDFSNQTDVRVPRKSVYGCKRIISRSLDQVTLDDYAVIELNREVLDRSPLRFRRFGKISQGEEIAVIGHPSGLPTKIADRAQVRSLRDKYFVANLDTYGGNSGSAVFNTRTLEVEGILVRGEQDYKYDSSQGCAVSNRCDDRGCRGEDVTFITHIEALKNLNN